MIPLKRFRFAALALLALCAAEGAPAQTAPVRLPRPSQKASVAQTVGVTEVTITYSRPGVKGRKIWGDPPAGVAAGTATLDAANQRLKDAPIVPYGRVWRAGANEATVFTVSDDVLVNGQKLPAGSYSLHAIPGREEWTIIFNSASDQWGSFSYDEKRDVLRVKARPQPVAENQEWLQYAIPDVTPTSARVVLRWEKIAVPFTVEVPDVEGLMRAKAEAAIAANPAEWRTPLSVANYYSGENKMDEALRWVERSVRVKETFQNLSARAQMLYAAGRKEEAFAAAERAIERGKADKVDTTRFEKRLADMKAGKM